LVVPKPDGTMILLVLTEVILGTVGLQLGLNLGNRTHNLTELELCSTTATEYHFVVCCKHPEKNEHCRAYLRWLRFDN